MKEKSSKDNINLVRQVTKCVAEDLSLIQKAIKQKEDEGKHIVLEHIKLSDEHDKVLREIEELQCKIVTLKNDNDQLDKDSSLNQSKIDSRKTYDHIPDICESAIASNHKKKK